MLKTRLTEMLQIEYPIIQAPMGYISNAKLAAAVSEAGGLGCLGAQNGLTDLTYDANLIGQKFREHAQKAKMLTSKLISFNVRTGRYGKAADKQRVQVGIEEGLAVAIVTGGLARPYVRQLHDGGVKVFQSISNVRHAQVAEADGVDAVIVAGWEAGGHCGSDQLTILALVPQVRDAVNVPVIAAGGIADGRGIAAALSLRADGVYMGTRFLATEECDAHPNCKRAVVEAADSGTIAYSHGPGFGWGRWMRNKCTEGYLEMQVKGASVDELAAYERFHPITPTVERARSLTALLDGDIDWGVMGLGQCSGLIKSIEPAANVVKRLVAEYEQAVDILPRI